jgi:organic radical activating enzyme
MQGPKQGLDNVKIQVEQPNADLVEIFSSFQGEGIFIGAKQIFIRFAECNLNCSFCDTPKGVLMKGMTIGQVLKEAKELERVFGLHHSVSLTGGEPLLHADFLECILPELKKEDYKIYLETNGTLIEKLKRVVDCIDIVAMDIKLPSSTKMPPFWERHLEFMKVAAKKNLFIKVVITDDTSQDDIMKAGDLIESIDSNIPLVLQPASVDEDGSFTVPKKRLLGYLELCKQRLKDVRIIPQVHKLMGIK